MAYPLYHGEGIILGGRGLGEASRLFLILTPDRGLISVVARGVRKPAAKLRGEMLLFARLEFSLVRGREFWRLVGARRLTRYDALAENRGKFQALSRLAGLVRRLVADEEAQPDLYRELKQSFQLIIRRDLSSRELFDLQLLTALRLLWHLGYLEKEKIPRVNPGPESIWHEHARTLIRQALSVSQL